MAHHEKSDRVHSKFARGLHVLPGNIRFRAVRCHANRANAGGIGSLEFFLGGDTGQDKGRHHRALNDIGDRFDPLPVGVRAKPVVEAATVETVAVGNFYGIDAGFIERLGNRGNMIHAIEMANRVHAIAQRHILDVDLLPRGIKDFATHAAAPNLSCAMRWPVASAAEVMMSRFPAYFGR